MYTAFQRQPAAKWAGAAWIAAWRYAAPGRWPNAM